MASSVPRFWPVALTAVLLAVGGCGTSEAADQPPPSPSATTRTNTSVNTRVSEAKTSTPPVVVSTTAVPTTPEEDPYPRPAWLGTRTLPTTADGVVVPQTTPPELLDRQIRTVDTLSPPDGDEFVWTIGPVVGEVLERSTWVDGCPVSPDGLAYLTMSFWGFDEQPHTGEMIVNASVADDVVMVFRTLFDSRFPIEEMRLVTPADLEADPTGDGNNTASFVCRSVTGGTRFSQHAYGLAIDINPFHNPYRRRDLVLPELAGSYLDRSTGMRGMVTADDVVVKAFADIGWSWGGNWASLVDYQHFSLNNR